jgi:hypothetical protein
MNTTTITIEFKCIIRTHIQVNMIASMLPCMIGYMIWYKSRDIYQISDTLYDWLHDLI